MRLFRYLPLLAVALAGCEQLGLDDSAKIAAEREADGKAIGGACRQSGRALEDCYAMYAKSPKAAIYAGWRDMDAYMRENKIPEVVPDTVEPPAGKKAAAQPAPPAGADQAPPADGQKPADKTSALQPPPAGKRMA